MDTNDKFAELSNEFTTWLTDSSNVCLSPKIMLADLRSSSAGRGCTVSGELRIVPTPPRELTSLDPWLALILVLIYETRPSSPWRPYIDILPHSFDALMYWSSKELGELQASAVVAKIGKEEADEMFREKLWPIVMKHIELFSDTEGLKIGATASFVDAAHRMGSIIMSYSFDLEVPEDQARIKSPGNSDDSNDKEEELFYKGMVPMADMLNADADQNNCRLFQTPTTLEMRTTRPISAGDELFNDYGPLPRSDLLRRYGYITSNYAQYDVAEISFDLITEVAGRDHDESDRNERIDYLLDEGVLDDAFDIGTDLEIPEVLAVVGSLLLTKEQFTILKGKGKVAKVKRSKEVANVLEEILEKRLSGYGSSIENDENILRDKSMQGRKKIAIEVKLGEKKILKGALAKVKSWVQPADSVKRTERIVVDGKSGGKRVRIQQ